MQDEAISTPASEGQQATDFKRLHILPKRNMRTRRDHVPLIAPLQRNKSIRKIGDELEQRVAVALHLAATEAGDFAEFVVI